MDKLLKAYIVLGSMALAVLPWLVIAATRGTEDVPVLGSICCSILSISAIIGGILVDNYVTNEREYNENAIRMLQESRKGLIEDLQRLEP